MCLNCGRKYCATCCLCFGIGFLALLLWMGMSGHTAIHAWMTTYGVCDKDDAMYDAFQNTDNADHPIWIDFFAPNYTNVPAFLGAGAEMLEVDSMGKYRFQLKEEKLAVSFSSDNSEVSFTNWAQVIYNQSLSCSTCTGDDVFIGVNQVYYQILEHAENDLLAGLLISNLDPYFMGSSPCSPESIDNSLNWVLNGDNSKCYPDGSTFNRSACCCNSPTMTGSKYFADGPKTLDFANVADVTETTSCYARAANLQSQLAKFDGGVEFDGTGEVPVGYNTPMFVAKSILETASGYPTASNGLFTILKPSAVDYSYTDDFLLACGFNDTGKTAETIDVTEDYAYFSGGMDCSPVAGNRFWSKTRSKALGKSYCEIFSDAYNSTLPAMYFCYCADQTGRVGSSLDYVTRPSYIASSVTSYYVATNDLSCAISPPAAALTAAMGDAATNLMVLSWLVPGTGVLVDRRYKDKTTAENGLSAKHKSTISTGCKNMAKSTPPRNDYISVEGGKTTVPKYMETTGDINNRHIPFLANYTTMTTKIAADDTTGVTMATVKGSTGGYHPDAVGITRHGWGFLTDGVVDPTYITTYSPDRAATNTLWGAQNANLKLRPTAKSDVYKGVKMVQFELETNVLNYSYVDSNWPNYAAAAPGLGVSTGVGIPADGLVDLTYQKGMNVFYSNPILYEGDADFIFKKNKLTQRICFGARSEAPSYISRQWAHITCFPVDKWLLDNAEAWDEFGPQKLIIEPSSGSPLFYTRNYQLNLNLAPHSILAIGNYTQIVSSTKNIGTIIPIGTMKNFVELTDEQVNLFVLLGGGVHALDCFIAMGIIFGVILNGLGIGCCIQINTCPRTIYEEEETSIVRSSSKLTSDQRAQSAKNLLDGSTTTKIATSSGTEGH